MPKASPEWTNSDHVQTQSFEDNNQARPTMNGGHKPNRAVWTVDANRAVLLLKLSMPLHFQKVLHHWTKGVTSLDTRSFCTKVMSSVDRPIPRRAVILVSMLSLVISFVFQSYDDYSWISLARLILVYS